MRSRLGVLPLVLPLFLLGARAWAADQLRLGVLVAVYPYTFTASSGHDEVQNVWREVAEAAAFVEHSSGRRLALDVETVVVERVLPHDDFQEVTPGQYFLNGHGRTDPVVENDLLALGHEPDRYDVVAVFYAWENRPSSLSPYGAAALGVNQILGKAAYLAVPLAWTPSSLNEYFEHELLHCVESMFEAAGHPYAVPFLHNGWAFEETYGSNSHDWYGWVLGHIAYQVYLDRPGPWGTLVRGAGG